MYRVHVTLVNAKSHR